jgi:hypothetical protein
MVVGYKGFMMSMWRVRLTRDVTESVDITVDAASAEEANERALDAAGKYGENLDGLWVQDDNQSEVYLPDAASTELA